MILRNTLATLLVHAGRRQRRRCLGRASLQLLSQLLKRSPTQLTTERHAAGFCITSRRNNESAFIVTAWFLNSTLMKVLLACFFSDWTVVVSNFLLRPSGSFLDAVAYFCLKGQCDLIVTGFYREVKCTAN